MSILSLNFITFVLVLVICYYILPGALSPYAILAGNIFFYTQFDLRYSLFLLFSVVTTFLAGVLISRVKKSGFKKFVLGLSISLNVGLLFFVKFVPYIIDNANYRLQLDIPTVSVIVPIGMSFYTLQVCGYCIDIYRGKYSPEKNIFKYMSFATFFPLMLQGPISRYDQLSKTLFAKKRLSDFYDNLTTGAQIALWGFFKKLVIADRAALLVNEVFDKYTEYSGIAVILAALCYTLQIYTDFSGCVDICRGVAKTFGIDIIDNFRQPYLSVSIQDFWKRWHIALSSWLKDYVYISLGGNRKGTVRKYINLIIVFLVSGLWHGVGVHFIVWGMLQAFYQIIGAVTLPLKKKLCTALRINRNSEGFIWIQRTITFCLINISWVIFRGDGMTTILHMLRSMFVFQQGKELIAAIDIADCIILLLGSLLLFVVGYYRDMGISIRKKVAACPIPVRWSCYLMLFLTILILGIYGPGYSEAAFIYMNF